MKMNEKFKIMMTVAAIVFLLTFTVACSCKHDYQNGICVDCGEADESYVAPCSHEYQAGVCILCGDVDKSYTPSCTHFYFNGVCVHCNEADPNYVAPCYHTYSEGVCVDCGEACEHSYVKGVCTVCQSDDPNYVPEDGGISMYADIVAKYKSLILYKYVNEELPSKGNNEPFYVDALYDVVGYYNPSLNFGYAYKDIDSDGYVELLLVENSNRMYAIFTIKDKAPLLVTTFQSGMGYLGNDGMVFFNSKRFDSSGGQIYLGNHMTHLVDGELVGITYGWEDSDGDFNTLNDDIYYLIDENGTKSVIDYDEYKVLRNSYEYYWSYSTRLTKLNNLQFQAALTETYLTDITADFSTYDAVINTLGLIYTEVGGGKLERSKWTGGNYDFGMRFASNEDFVTYNRLIGACVLAQKSSNPTFGYAKSDLNGDGVDELVILESKYYVLAVFTEVNGKVQLLEAFDDRRSAFIDENGLIHVSEKIIPGSKDDYEYSVYEIAGGKLISKLSIGTVTNGDEVKIYKTVDGSVTEIEKTEWDQLYSEYSGEIGNNTFEAYTKENSGLVFVAIPEK